MKRFFRIEHALVALLSMALLGVLIFLSLNISFLSPVAKAVEEFSLTDFFYQIENENSDAMISHEIAIVNLKDQHDRSVIAQTIRDIDAASPLVLAADVIFESELADTLSNRLLVESVEDCKSYVGAMLLKNYDNTLQTYTEVARSCFSDSTKHAEGYTNLNIANYGGNLRELTVWRTLNSDTVFSFPAEIVASVANNKEDMKTLNVRLIDFHHYEFPIIAYDSVLQNRSLLENKIVLLGSTDEMRDTYNTPIGVMSGVEVQAFSVMTLLTNVHRVTVGMFGILLIAFIACYLMNVMHQSFIGWASSRKKPWVAFLSSSKMMIRLLTFFWMGVFSWIGFILYMSSRIYLPLEFILASIVLVVEARNIIQGVKDSIVIWRNNKKRS